VLRDEIRAIVLEPEFARALPEGGEVGFGEHCICIMHLGSSMANLF
jgi:hypothetical protein